MKAKTLLAAAVFLAVLTPHNSLSRPREKRTAGIRPYVEVPAELKAEGEALLESLGRPMMTAAPVDTYCVVWYDFEVMDWQGWTVRDGSAQIDTFFHVDDFAGLGGGDYGRLVPIEGMKSAWCGVRQGDDFYTCTWNAAPGYGNGWDQALISDSIEFVSPLSISFHGVFDSEPEWDYTFIEYASGDSWTVLDSIDGVLDTVAVYTIFSSLASTKLRFHFVADGAWSDQDGLYDTDGACIIDSITVSDGSGLIHFEDFESSEVGDLDTDFWHCRPGAEAFGTYCGLAANLQDKDPCGKNFTTQIVFHQGSPWMSDDYPGMPVTPFCAGAGGIEEPCQNVQAVSPVIDMTRYSSSCDENQDMDIPGSKLPGLGGSILRFTVYRDLPLSNLVMYCWAVRNIIDGCPGQWQDRASCAYYGGDRDYIQASMDVSDLVGPLPMQVSLYLVDWCGSWYLTYGDCSEHTPAPYFDNVRVYRYETSGPQWRVRNLDLFQDTFPQEVQASPDPMEEYCRADMANDIAPGDEFTRIDPGDSAVVQVSSPLNASSEHRTGLDTLATGENRVYFHCNVEFLGVDGKPDLTGPQLEGTYGTWLETDGSGWDIFLCGRAATSSGNYAPDKYAIDLNDSLFTRGYMIEYYFKAWSLDGIATTHPHNAEEPDGDRYEFTCLPTLRMVPGILFCDDYHNRGTFDGLVQLYYDGFFEQRAEWTLYFPDRYDTNGPSSGVSNGIGAYSQLGILSYAYEVIIHDSGDLNSVTITEGTDNSDKSNDAQALVDWMNQTEHKVGLLVMGDQVAYDLSQSNAAVALELVSTICGVTLEDNSYYELTGGSEAGGVVNPLITGVNGGPYYGLIYYSAGGCPIINDFDVLEKTGPGEYALQYPDYNSVQYYAGIYTDQLNSAGFPLRTVWVGHSLMQIRNTVNGWPDRYEFLHETYCLFEQLADVHYIEAEIPRITSLANNFPNPFNPSTRIRFSLSRKSHVRLRIYDVAGRLVRVLVDETRPAGKYDTVWNGKTRNGSKAASGVYFCRMEAADYERSMKMVLLR
jgi:hypothetical protein